MAPEQRSIGGHVALRRKGKAEGAVRPADVPATVASVNDEAVARKGGPRMRPYGLSEPVRTLQDNAVEMAERHRDNRPSDRELGVPHPVPRTRFAFSRSSPDGPT